MVARLPSLFTRHRVFVSYHHANDQAYRDAFEAMFAGQSSVFVSKSVQIEDIADGLSTDYVRQKIRDEYLRDSTVTVVLVGTQTWQRKHVDWEISSTWIRDFNLRAPGAWENGRYSQWSWLVLANR
jgi:hypothetical protein